MQDITKKAAGVEKVKAATEKLVDMFVSGKLPAAVARTMIAAKTSDLPSSKWSLGNQLLMYANGTGDARGYKQWRGVGRHVKKGSKCFYILAPKTATRKVEDPDTGEEKRITIVTGFLGVPVFRVEDTDGEPVETPIYTPDVLPPLYHVARAWGYAVSYGPADGKAFGWHRMGHIHLMTHDQGTLWHELAHAAHAKVLESRGSQIRGGQVPEQEIVAEMTAAALGEMYGDTTRHTYSRRYLEGYSEAMHKDLLGGMMRCLSDVQQCLNMILDAAVTVEPAEVPAS